MTADTLAGEDCFYDSFCDWVSGLKVSSEFNSSLPPSEEDCVSLGAKLLWLILAYAS